MFNPNLVARVLAMAAIVMGGVVHADNGSASGGDCQTHFATEGSFFSGKIYTTWTEFPSVAKPDAFSRIYVAVAKDGWTIGSADKDAGIISASQSVSFGKGSVAPMTIVVEAAKNGSKVTATFRTGGGQMAKEDVIRTKMCTYVGAAATS